ncbi:MAG: OadG family protein [Chloroflexi bacterium]|nr:OadG family protein [Chloroflexota bacterium]
MNAFDQGLEVTAIGMLLVFLSLVIVAGLIWALGKVFPGRAPEAKSEPASRAPEAPLLTAVTQGAAATEVGLADQAAAIAVALVRQRAAAPVFASSVASQSRAYVAMPWERPAEMWGDELLQGETVTVIDVDPGSGNWKSQGRLAAME